MRLSAVLALLAVATALAPRAAGAQSAVQIVHTLINGEDRQPTRPIEAADGYLYGTGSSSLYRLDKGTGAYTTLVSIPVAPYPSLGPGFTNLPLVEGPSGTLFGIGTNRNPPEPGTGIIHVAYTLFRLELATNTFTVPYAFSAASPVGTKPSALVRGPGGALYGTTAEGGTSGTGMIFRVDPATSAVTPLAGLPRASTGYYRYSSMLTVGRDGRLYGISTEHYDKFETIVVATGGIVFRYDVATNSVESLYSTTSNQIPVGDLVVTADGMLYGMSTVPDSRWGTRAVFRFEPATQTFSIVNAFDDPQPNRIYPITVTAGPGGALYVTTVSTGADGRWRYHIMRLDPATGGLSTVHAFTDAEGDLAFPFLLFQCPGMTLASDGLMYGTTINGVGRMGAVYRLAVVGSPPALDTDSDGLPNDWEISFGLDPSLRNGDDDPDYDGKTNVREYQDGTHPRGIQTRYFAEGATGTFFKTRFAVLSGGVQPASVRFRFLKDDGTVVGHTVYVPTGSRATIDAATLPGLESANFSAVVESSALVAVDRTMTWDGRGYGSDTETGIVAPATTWYLAEGSTSGDFELFYLLQNPADTPVIATVRYLRPDGQPPIEKTYPLAPRSRRTIYVDTEGAALASTDVSAVITAPAPIVVERAMYLNKAGQPFAAGHVSAGVTAPAHRWFFAEGATGTFFDEFLLIANPHSVASDVTVDYMLLDGGTLTKTYTVAANSRFTIWVDDEQIPAGSGQRPLANASLSAMVRSTNEVPIVAERTMWWPGPEVTANFWYEAHNSPGATTPALGWLLAEGELGGPSGLETYVMIANTSPFPGRANVLLITEDGHPAGKGFPLPPLSRTNVWVGGHFPELAGRRFGIAVYSVRMTTDSPAAAIVVERAMYSSPGGMLWAAGTDALGAPVP